MAESSSRGSVFQWGVKVAGSLSSYESMCFNGVRYDLYDCVFVRSGLVEPYLGKIMRMFEDEHNVKKVRLRWFFRHYELPVSARKDIRQGENKKDVYIAQGNMRGVENENPVQVILGKAVVLCTAKCRDNPLPSQLQVDGAHHIFCRVFDVSNRKLGKLDKIDRSLGELSLHFQLCDGIEGTFLVLVTISQLDFLL